MEDTPYILKIYDIIYSRVFPPEGWGMQESPQPAKNLLKPPPPNLEKFTPPPTRFLSPPHKRLIHPN